MNNERFQYGIYEKQSWMLDKKIELLQLNKIKVKEWFIAGGACRSVFTSEKINDLDIFFYDDSVMGKFKKEFEDLHGIQYPAFETESAVSYNVEEERVQLIRKIYGIPEIIISNFDFSIVQCCYSYLNKGFTMSSNFLYDNAQKKLRYNINIPDQVYPIASLIRSMKYVKRGYSFSGVEALKLSLVINNLQLKTYKDLREQLEGIDTLLLKDITDALLGDPGKRYDFKEFMALAEEKLAKLWDNEEQ